MRRDCTRRATKRLGGAGQLMPDFPLPIALFNMTPIGTWSPECIGLRPLDGMVISFGLNNAWPSANLAIYLPVEIYRPVTIVKMGVNNGTTVNGNFDLGLYDANGVRLVSSGSTAQSGASALQTVDITDTLLMPGLYYMGMASSSATGTYSSWTGGASVDYRQMGVAQQATAFALPNPMVPAAFAQTYLPLVTMFPRTTI
jgi:hypothetical protein